MIQDSELSKLESFVEKMMSRFTELQAEKAQLLRDVLERDVLIEELRGNISTKDSERGEVSQRVNKIVEQIEEWEKGFEEIQSPAGSDNAQNTVLLESDKVTSGTDDERRVQHNLFSMANSDN